MATREEARQQREAKLDELHDKLTGAVERLVTGDDWADALRFAAKFRSRSFNNVLLIWTAHMEAFEQGRVPEPFPTLVAGYKQWQQLGRQVEKDQAGYQILAPVTGRFASANLADAMSWRRLNRGEKPKPGETVRTRMVGVRPAYVWDVSQTSGEPIPARPEPQLLKGEAPAGLRDGLADQVRAEGFELLWVPHEGMIGGANGRTNFTENWVAVRTNMDDAAQVKTLAHELAHVLMHGPDQQEARQHRGIGEVEADSVALMIGAAHGMDTSEYTIPPRPSRRGLARLHPRHRYHDPARRSLAHHGPRGGVIEVFPDFEGLSGIEDLREVAGALLMFVLIVAVLMLIVSGICWAIGSSNGNYQLAHRGRAGVFVSFAGAIFAGASVTWLNWLITIGNQL